MIAESVYILCALTSFACAVLLMRAYQRSRMGLLLWSSLCFVAFALNNLFLIIDLMVLPEVDLFPLRTLFMLAGFALLLYGLIWERV